MADAIARGDRDDLCEELGRSSAAGRLSRAARRGGRQLSPLMMSSRRSAAKMIRRHPHVFGDEEARSAHARQGFLGRVPRRASKKPQRAGDACTAFPSPSPASPAPSSFRPRPRRSALTGRTVDDRLRQDRRGDRRTETGVRRGARGGIWRSSLRRRQCRRAIWASTRKRPARRQCEIRAPLSPHRDGTGRSAGRQPAQSTLAEMDGLWNEAKAGEKA